MNKNAKAPQKIYQLKITLTGTRPPIWRRILVPDTMRLDQLHDAIQAVFGWFNYHLHEFESGRQRYGKPDPETDVEGYPPAINERKVVLSQVMRSPRARLKYTYDFGDDWEHAIVLEKTLAPDPELSYPACIGGKMRCPPEDCGGIPGFHNFLKIMGSPEHPEHSEMLEWAGRSFDRNDFSVAEADSALRPTKRTRRRT